MLFVCHLLDNKTNWLSSASHISRISRPVWTSCHADQSTCYTWYRPAADEPKTRARYKKRITWKTWPAARFSLHFQCHRRTFAAFGDEAAPGFLSKGLVPVISPAFFRETGDSHNKIHVNKASNRWVEEQRELGAFLCHVRLNVHETVRTLTLIASLSLVRRHHLALRAGYCYGERLPMICVTVFVSRITWTHRRLFFLSHPELSFWWPFIILDVFPVNLLVARWWWWRLDDILVVLLCHLQWNSLR